MADNSLINIDVRLRQRYNSTAVWEAVNPVLERGEIGVECKHPDAETPNARGLIAIKVGDGFSTWKELPYASGAGGGMTTTDKELITLDVPADAKVVGDKFDEVWYTINKNSYVSPKITLDMYNVDSKYQSVYEWLGQKINISSIKISSSNNADLVDIEGTISNAQGFTNFPTISISKIEKGNEATVKDKTIAIDVDSEQENNQPYSIDSALGTYRLKFAGTDRYQNSISGNVNLTYARYIYLGQADFSSESTNEGKVTIVNGVIAAGDKHKGVQCKESVTFNNFTNAAGAQMFFAVPSDFGNEFSCTLKQGDSNATLSTELIGNSQFPLANGQSIPGVTTDYSIYFFSNIPNSNTKFDSITIRKVG